MEYGTYSIVRYPRLKSMNLLVNCVLDSSVAEDGYRVLCKLVGMKKTSLGKTKKKIKRSGESKQRFQHGHIQL